MRYRYLSFSIKDLTYFILTSVGFICLPACNKTDKSTTIENKIDAANTSIVSTVQSPNIIVIVGDDVGYDALPSNGNETFETPNIDRMVQEGMRFTQCHAAPLCSPSRFMLVTGKYNFRNYQTGVLGRGEKTFANLLKDAGYSTYVAGKWQFDGGDAAIHGFGFDRYVVWNPVKKGYIGLFYKNADLYSNGSYISKTITQDKYDNDIYTDSVLSFIQENKEKKFFVYLPFTLVHGPYCPTPDDTKFANWVSDNKHSDTKYFPSMMKYMDKKMGQIIDSLKAWNLYNNTIVMFLGDNGTPNHIFYYYNGQYIEGSKDSPTEAGTHIPLVITWPNGITGGQVNNNLVDLTDFLPTIGDAAGVPIPASYGTTDGISFYDQLKGLPTTPRNWTFCQLEQKRLGTTLRWTQNVTYKLYDDGGKFVKISTDPQERNPLIDLTPAEQQLKIEFQNRLNTLH